MSHEFRHLPRRCRYCPAMVYDLTHIHTGKSAAITQQTWDDGNVAIDRAAGTYQIVVPGPGLHKNHFVDCAGKAQADTAHRKYRAA